MDAQKFTGKQLLIIFGISVLTQVIGGLIIYHLTKPKTPDPATTPPAPTNLGTTQTQTSTVSTVPTTTTTTQG